MGSSQLLGITGQSQMAAASLDQADDTGTPDQLWHFIPIGTEQFNIENLFTHQVAGITAASTATGAIALQYSIPVYTNPAVAGSNSGPEAVIALATSANPNGPWTDAGQIISSCGTTAGQSKHPKPTASSSSNLPTA